MINERNATGKVLTDTGCLSELTADDSLLLNVDSLEIVTTRSGVDRNNGPNTRAE
jgi:hypothetical protein